MAWGGDALAFWSLTPHLLNVAVDGCSDAVERNYKRILSGSWHTALFAKMERLPPHEDLFKSRDELDTSDAGKDLLDFLTSNQGTVLA